MELPTEKKQHKILLIEPPFCRLFKDTYSLDRYPLSLGYLAGTIKKETDWGVMAYNADFCHNSELIKVSYLTGEGFHNYLNNLKDFSGQVWKEIKSTIQEYKPMVIGITAASQNFKSACMVAKLAKEIDSNIVVMVGGPHSSMVGKDVLKCQHIDIGVRGEGEKTIIELLNTIKMNKGFDGIKGIVYRKNGQNVENPLREFIEDLDSLCFPHEYAPQLLKDYEKYPLTAFKFIFAIRGCPYNCFFCGSREIWSRRARFRSPENIVREIKGLQKKGLKFVHFDDDTFGVNKKYISDLCNTLIRDCPGLKWSCELPIKLIDEETISLIKKAGCYSIQIGIESGNNQILKEMRKNITIEEALSACKIIKKYGIKLLAFFIVGFPQETEETLNDTVKAMKKAKCDVVTYSIFTPYPGTEIFEFCREKGLVDDNYDVSLYNHRSPANCFCVNIPPNRFRALVSKIEKKIDRKNSLNRIKQVFSFNTLDMIRERGIGKSLKEGIKVFTGK
ncbi:radical SAM protein [Candidatus Woesearchaeota archaeon]|nr:radical SAM protein [Candidatus Woesearchaeota archaeon]